MTVLQFESKNIREFRTYAATCKSVQLKSMLGHYLNRAAQFDKVIRKSREAVLGELTMGQFRRYQEFHKYMDTLTNNQIEAITTRQKTLGLIEKSRHCVKRLSEVNSLIKILRSELGYKEVA